jgi:hypothetical protein
MMNPKYRPDSMLNLQAEVAAFTVVIHLGPGSHF